MRAFSVQASDGPGDSGRILAGRPINGDPACPESTAKRNLGAPRSRRVLRKRAIGSHYSPRTLCTRSAVFLAPSFFSRLARWKSTVRGLMPSVRPASLLEAPRMIEPAQHVPWDESLMPGERFRQDIECTI